MTKPFKSKFLPYVDQIKAWRRAGQTWQEVAEQLTSMGVKADAGNVCRVMGRIKRRPYPIGAEPEDPKKEHQAATTTSESPQRHASTPPSLAPQSPHLAALRARKEELEQAKEPEVSDWDAFSIDPDQELEKPNT